MRLNKYIALATGIGRRAADDAITAGRVQVNDDAPSAGQDITPGDVVKLNDKVLTLPEPGNITTVMLNKPAGYVVSRNGQGSQTVYDLLPAELQQLKPVGRLDKESSGLLLLTNDGQLAHELTHPSRQKNKVYEVILTRPLAPLHRQMITDYGVLLDDGPSKFQLERIEEGNDKIWKVIMHEGRNRQIRRTFQAVGYRVTSLHRTQFGHYVLRNLQPGSYMPA